MNSDTNTNTNTNTNPDLGANPDQELATIRVADCNAAARPFAEGDQDATDKPSGSLGSVRWLLLSLCPPLLVFEAVRSRRWRPLLCHLIGWLAFLIYSGYHDPTLLVLRCAAIPIWTAIGGHQPSPAQRSDAAEPGAAQPPNPWKEDDSWLWALAHLVPLLWIHVAIQRRTLWPYALVLTTTLLARDGQLMLGLGDDVAIPLTLPLIPLAAWIGLRLASRQAAPMPCLNGST